MNKLNVSITSLRPKYYRRNHFRVQHNSREDSSLEFELLSWQSQQHISAPISAWSCRPIATPGRTDQFFRPSQARVLQLSLSPSRCFTTDPFSPASIWNHNKRAWQILRSNWNLRLCLSVRLSVSILASVYKHSWPKHPPINPPPRSSLQSPRL